MPACDGYLADVVLGFDRLNSYLTEHPYFEAIVEANRRLQKELDPGSGPGGFRVKPTGSVLPIVAEDDRANHQGRTDAL